MDRKDEPDGISLSKYYSINALWLCDDRHMIHSWTHCLPTAPYFTQIMQSLVPKYETTSGYNHWEVHGKFTFESIL